MKRFLAALALMVVLAGCESPSAGKSWVRSEVYFGLSKPDGSMVTTAEWQAFVDDVVTPKFPAGLSVVDTAGQWRDAQGKVIHEPSRMLILLHPRSAATEAQIDAIRAEYCKRFNQEAVMKVTTRARVVF